MTNQELVADIIDNLERDSGNPGRMLAQMHENCVYVIYPGAISFHGKATISRFVEVAMASRDGSMAAPTQTTLITRFSDERGDHICIEFEHAFSFGSKIPGLGRRASATVVQHCNVYSIEGGQITSVHEYASSSVWWLNVAMQFVLKRMHKRVLRTRTALV